MTGIEIVDDFLLLISSLINPDVTDDMAWHGGKMLGRIDLKQIEPGVFARRDVADNYLRMKADASNEGIKIKAYSGFRSMSKQRKLFEENLAKGKAKGLTTPYPPTAKPGFSNHQGGTALDIEVGMKIEDLNKGNYTKEFNWMAKNSEKYGFKRLPSEPWHYSTDGR